MDKYFAPLREIGLCNLIIKNRHHRRRVCGHSCGVLCRKRPLQVLPLLQLQLCLRAAFGAVKEGIDN